MLLGIPAWSAFSCRCLSAFLMRICIHQPKQKRERRWSSWVVLSDWKKKLYTCKDYETAVMKIMKQPLWHTMDLYLQIQNRNGGQLLVVSFYTLFFLSMFHSIPKRAFHSVNGNHTRIREEKVVFSFSFWLVPQSTYSLQKGLLKRDSQVIWDLLLK